jgi:peptide/nickel transport system permease protein
MSRALGTPTGLIGGVIVLLMLLAALFAPWIAPHDPDALDVLNRFLAPTFTHPLGTDHLGRDMAARLLFGARIALAVALAAIVIALLLGTALGVLAALLPPWGERPLLVLFDAVAAFPSLVLALAVVATFGPSTVTVIAVVGITLMPHFGRVARAQVLALSAAPFLEAERILGAGQVRIVVHHILPNIAGPLLVLASMDIPVVITIEAGLSFLGLGVRPPLASWGVLIQDGYQFLSDSPIPVAVSSAALALATLGFTLFGEALRDAIDPRLRAAP